MWVEEIRRQGGDSCQIMNIGTTTMINNDHLGITGAKSPVVMFQIKARICVCVGGVDGK